MPQTKIPLISREELKAKLDRGDDFVLVEALPPPHYREGHLPKAINLPHSGDAARSQTAPGPRR